MLAKTHTHTHTTSGFTLIEILVALLIFAIMGVLAAMSLHTLIRAHQQLKKSDRHLMQLEMTMTLLRSDLMQVIDRKVRDADGSKAPAFAASGGGGIAFTRTGFNLARVGYSLKGNDLVRLTWDVLDQPPRATPESQVILSGVKSLIWQFVADDGRKSSEWPPAEGSNMQKENQSDLPKVVLMVMDVDGEGIVQGVFPIPARGMNAAKAATSALP